jgi:hypothetical protein
MKLINFLLEMSNILFSFHFLNVIQLLNMYLIKVLNGIIITNALQFDKEPNGSYVRLNTNILLECKIDDFQVDTDIVEWCKNDFCTWFVFENKKFILK